MEKSQLRKRFESFVWRAGMMVLVLLVDWVLDNLGLFNLNPQVVIVFGLVLGEISKWLKNRGII